MVMCLNCGAWCQDTSDNLCTECGFSKFDSGNETVGMMRMLRQKEEVKPNSSPK